MTGAVLIQVPPPSDNPAPPLSTRPLPDYPSHVIPAPS